MRRIKSSRGTALLEVAFILPLILLLAVGIFEFGRAYETMQVLTNAAREGARVAVLPAQPTDVVPTRVKAYLNAGGLVGDSAGITVTPTTIALNSTGSATASGSKVTVTYPFSFMVIQPIAKMVSGSSSLGDAFTMTAVSEMRNEQ
jgi:Flp pilus assembly protein TadG